MQNVSNAGISFKPLEELTLMDDYMFSTVMRDKDNLKPLIECILGVTITDITFVEPQKTEKEGYQSHGICLDIYVRDDMNRIFNVEIQTSSKKNLPKRMRYYQSMIDINVLAPGVDYRNLRDSFVIFICSYDPFGQNRYLYSFENRCMEDNSLPLGDGSIKVIVNTKGSNGEITDSLKEILLYLNEGKATGVYTRHLDKEIQHVKSSEERRHEYMVMMIREMEIREEGKEEGRTEGRSEGIAEINALYSWLLSENRLDDLRRATTDTAYQSKLLNEFSLLKDN